ncbi:glycosyltransferase [Fimbriimonas ginsengisoli]|uniref:Glycosyl transferase group 1 n=1 Tax=Fimbriimonas ginsengisoli Gsoil 348 TaxID=661478 RepID=A0A068NLC3_FIMGI|nr:glycosyltransferase [Fimbriimonas ginsengisoli]AIE84281.1 glycosyl transferase group 1 [Fimbriimonas ginsengisoli Gsoil 348]
MAFSHLRWNFVWQRPQQFLSRFAQEHPVLFIEEPDFRLNDGDEPVLAVENAASNVTVATLHLPASLRGSDAVGPLMLHYARLAIETVNHYGQFDNPLLWYYSPMEAAWSLGEIEGRAVVYDCMDELSQFAGAPRELIDNERRLMQEADIVFTGGYELYLKKSKQHPNVHFFGCGVEYDHFAKAQSQATAIPDDIRHLAKPIVGWFGVVDERVDYSLLKRMAELRPDWSFVLVGPVVKVDPNTLPQAPNLHWPGGRDYKVLPDYCAAYDVCMMCFALNEATQYINPTKALEYLATGKPVVSTPVSDVVRQYADTVAIASTPEDFVACIERALNAPDEIMIQRGIEKARQASWEATVERMQELIDEAVGTAAAPAFMS